MTFNPATPAARAAARILMAMAFAGVAAGASAQDWTAPRKGDAATRNWEKPKPSAPKRVYTEEESNRLGAEARREAVARQEGWDRKMKALSGSICAGC